MPTLIRISQANRVFAATHLAVKAGEQANFSSAESDRKVEATFEVGPGCASGTYVVKVWVNGKLAYSKNGTLEPKAQ